MQAQVMIDAMIRQQTILIAHLATAAGMRAPLAHIADQIFLEISKELRRLFMPIVNETRKMNQESLQNVNNAISQLLLSFWS